MLLVAILTAGCFSAEARKRAAQLQFEGGKRLYDRCEFPGAQKRFERALKLNPNHLAAREYLRIVKRMQGIPDEIDLEEFEVEPKDERRKR
jgi:hypothetical protein